MPIRQFTLGFVAFLALTGCTSHNPSPPEADAGDASDATSVDAPDEQSESSTENTDGGTDAPDDVPTSSLCSKFEADGGVDAPWDGAVSGSIVHPCTLPGSLQHPDGGTAVLVPGGHLADGGALPDVSYLKVPGGFCVHYFGNVGNARQIRFAPGGEAFVASPTAGTTSGGQNGQSAVMVLPDDNNDGVADLNIKFMGGLVSTQGLLFTGGYFYYQDAGKIMRIAYAPGARAPSGAGQLVADIGATYHQDPLHWPKPLDVADDGTIYVGNGGGQGDNCVAPPWPFLGGILKLDGTPGGTVVARGFRNPIAIRCARGHNQCFALELAKDYATPPTDFGREKLIPIPRSGMPVADWGFPCCATTNVPYTGIVPPPNCSAIAPVSDSFYIGDTPFGLDFEPGLWPGPWAGHVFVALHGAAGSWQGARLAAIPMDPCTGLPLAGTNYTGGPNTGALVDFATGWQDQRHGRPTAMSFSADGRLFLTNDTTGDILWLAPLDL